MTFQRKLFFHYFNYSFIDKKINFIDIFISLVKINVYDNYIK